MDTDLAEEYLIQGLRLEAHGQLDKAIQYYKKAYKLKPSLECREENFIMCKGKMYDDGGWPLFDDEDPLEFSHASEAQKDDNTNTKMDIKSKCVECKYPRVIAVGGPSRCGKSTLVRKYIDQHPEKCVILSQDFFFNKNIPKDEKSGYENWENAEAVNWKKIQEALHTVLDEHKICCKQHEDDFTTTPKEPSSNPFIVFLEGHLIFQPFMLDFYDEIIFLKIDRETCWKRRIATTPVHPFYFDEFLWPGAVEQTQYVMEYLKSEHGKKFLVMDGSQESETVEIEFFRFMSESNNNV